MPQVQVEMTSDEARAWAGIMRVAKGMDDLERSTRKTAEASKDLKREQEQMGRDAQRIWEQTRTPLEKYEEEMKRLGGLYQSNKLDLETYYRAAEQADQSYRRSVGETKQEVKNFGAAHKEAFGAQAVESLAGYVSGMISVGAAVGGVIGVLKEVKKLKEEAAQSNREVEFGYGSLAEVSGGDAKQFAKNVSMAKHISGMAGMNENQATRLTFALSSAGAMDEADTFAKAYQEGVVTDPENLLRGSTAMRKAYGNRMTNHQMLNLAFAAGEASPSKANELLGASAEAAAHAQGAGVSESELLAATAVNATVMDPTGGASKGGTAVRALMKALARMGSGAVEGDEGDEGSGEDGPVSEDTKKTRKKIQANLHLHGSLMDRLHQIQAMHLSEADTQKLFGRQEGMIAYKNLLANEADYSGSLTRQAEGAKEDLFSKVLSLPGTDPDLAAAASARIEAQKEKLAGKKAGTKENAMDAIRSDRRRKLKDQDALGQAAAENLSHAMTGWIPGDDPIQLKARLAAGELDDRPDLAIRAVQALGGEQRLMLDKDYKKRRNWAGWALGVGDDASTTAAREHWQTMTAGLRNATGEVSPDAANKHMEAAAALTAAAQKLSEAADRQGHPTPQPTGAIAQPPRKSGPMVPTGVDR